MSEDHRPLRALEGVRAAHQRNQARITRLGLPLFALGFVLFGVGGYGIERFSVPAIGATLAVVGAGLGVAGILVVIRFAKCPFCNAALSNRRGVMIDPVECPHCGVNFS